MRETSNKIICVIILLALLLTGCQSNNSEIETLKKENAQLQQQIDELSGKETSKASDETSKITNGSEFDVNFENDSSPMIFGNSEHIAEIKDVAIVYSPNLDKYLLRIDFHYTNKKNDSSNFINNLYCNVIAYQDGIELDSTDFTSEKDVYDTNSSYTMIKNAEIDTQLVFVLKNTESDIELELGSDYYSSLITKKIVISEK